MESQLMTLEDYIAVLKRRKWGLVAPTIIISLAAAIIAMVLPSLYKSTATILIEEQEIRSDLVMTSVTSYAEQRLQSINQKIMIASRLLDISKRFNLYPELDPEVEGVSQEIVNRMKESILLEPIDANRRDRRTGRSVAVTIAFSLSYEGKNPETTQQVASELSALFLEENLKVREKQALGTTEFIQGELKKIGTELEIEETKIATFKEKYANELPELLQINTQSLYRYEQELDSLKEKYRTIKEKENYIKAQLAVATPQKKLDDQKKRLEELKLHLTNLTLQFSDKYPDVVKAKADLAELEKQYVLEKEASASLDEPPDNPAYISLSSQLASVTLEINSLNRQINNTNEKIEEYSRRIAATPKIEEEYRPLVLKRKATQAKYDDLSKKLMESKVSYGLEKEQMGERFTLIEPARVANKPHKPNRLAIILLGFVLGVGVGISTIALQEYNDTAIHGAEDLIRATSRPVLGSIPEIITQKDLKLQRTKRLAQLAGIVLILVGSVMIIHFFIIDLNLLWADVMERMGGNTDQG